MSPADEDLLVKIKTLVDMTTKEAAAARTPQSLRMAISVAVINAIDVGMAYVRTLDKKSRSRAVSGADNVSNLRETRPGFRRPIKS